MSCQVITSLHIGISSLLREKKTTQQAVFVFVLLNQTTCRATEMHVVVPTSQRSVEPHGKKSATRTCIYFYLLLRIFCRGKSSATINTGMAVKAHQHQYRYYIKHRRLANKQPRKGVRVKVIGHDKITWTRYQVPDTSEGNLILT